MTDESDRVTLRDHFEKQIEWVDKYFQRQLDSAQDAITKAEDALKERLAGMNEFRKTIEDRADRFATKEYMESLEKRINSIERSQSSGEGKDQNKAAVWVAIFSLFGTGVAIVLFLMSRK